MNLSPAVLEFRGNECENIHFASAVVCSKTGKLVRMFPNSDTKRVFIRSAAKPFQAFPLYQNPQAKDISLEEWAIICASHSASEQQLTLVSQLLEKAGATVTDLQCGPHPPFDKAMATRLLCSDTPPTALHNNCSGKHAGMLLACRYYNWPWDTYLEPEHPLQQAILKTIVTYSGTADLSLGIDGCGAPVTALPLTNMASLYSSLASHDDLAPLCKAMIRFPHIVGSPDRIDTQIMNVCQGHLVAKVGAEGVLCVGNQQTGEGLALKIHTGVNPIRDRLIIATLEDLGWLDAEQAEQLWMQPQFSKEKQNTQNKTVGHYQFSLVWE